MDQNGHFMLKSRFSSTFCKLIIIGGVICLLLITYRVQKPATFRENLNRPENVKEDKKETNEVYTKIGEQRTISEIRRQETSDDSRLEPIHLENKVLNLKASDNISVKDQKPDKAHENDKIYKTNESYTIEDTQEVSYLSVRKETDMNMINKYMRKGKKEFDKEAQNIEKGKKETKKENLDKMKQKDKKNNTESTERDQIPAADLHVNTESKLGENINEKQARRKEIIVDQAGRSNDDSNINETEQYALDVRRDYVQTKYIMHKIMEDNGPNLSPKKRAKLVKKRCETFLKENNIQLNPNAKLAFESFLISRRYNVSICYNCKVASTNTKRLLYALDNMFTGDINRIKQHMARAYATGQEKTFQQVMSDKRRVNVMMVREPLERLLSAYRDRRAFKEQFKDPSFTFKKYLQLVLGEKLGSTNRHNYPYFEKCRPCEVPYDFIGLQNNFDDDVRVILKKIGAAGKVDIPERKKTGYKTKSSDTLLKHYFKAIPNDMIHKLWEKYYKDYYIFGFPYPVHLMN